MGHFYFVRHGQTIWNVENKICGATVIALTEFGRETYFRDDRHPGAAGAAADGAEFWKMGVHSTRWSGLQKGEGMLRNEPRGRRIDSAAGAENL